MNDYPAETQHSHYGAVSLLAAFPDGCLAVVFFLLLQRSVQKLPERELVFRCGPNIILRAS